MRKDKLLQMVSEEIDEALAACKSDNPLEAWTSFIDRLDSRMRRRIGDQLEQQGRDRHTGK